MRLAARWRRLPCILPSYGGDCLELSRSLLKKFASITRDSEVRQRVNSYGTAVVVGSAGDNAVKYVRLDGSEVLTPVSEAADVRDGDRVLVSVENHVATISGNLTSPPSGRGASELKPIVEGDNERINGLEPIVGGNVERINALVANQITTVYLEANYAKINRLDAQEARIGVLEANRITASYLEANYAKVASLEANTARINTLEANQITTSHLKANYAEIDLANVTQASIGTMLANVGLVSNMTISQGFITGELQGVTISANQLTAGRIDAANIEVVNLNASNLTVGTINGTIIRPGTITAAALSEELNNAISEKSDASEALRKIEENRVAAEAMINTVRSDLGVVGNISVHGGNIQSETITAGQLAANAVTADKIAANAITAGKISVAELSSITASMGTLIGGVIKSPNYEPYDSSTAMNCKSGMLINLDTGFIQSPNFAVTALGTVYVKGKVYATSGSISGSLVTSGLNADNITVGTLSADRLAAGSISGDKLIAGTITATQIAAGTITADQIAGNTITSAEIKSGAITAAKIASGAVTADKLAVGSLSAITADIGTITAGKIGDWTINDRYIQSKVSSYGQVLYLHSEGYIRIEKITYPIGVIFEVGPGGCYVKSMEADSISVNGAITSSSMTVNGALTASSMTTDGTVTCNNLKNNGNISSGYVFANNGVSANDYLNTYGYLTASGTITSNSTINSTLSSASDAGLIATNSAGAMSFIISGAGNKGIYCRNSSTWILRMGTDNIIYSYNVYAKTVTSSANINVSTAGALRRYASSSERYKHGIRYYSNVDKAVSSVSKRAGGYMDDSGLLSILNLPVCSFLYDDGYIDEEGFDPNKPIYGFIAEDVNVWSPDAVDYYKIPGDDVRPAQCTAIPESWDVKKLFPKAVYVIQKHEEKIQECMDVIGLMYSTMVQAGLLNEDVFGNYGGL